MSTHTYREVLHEVQQLSLEEQVQLLGDLLITLQQREQRWQAIHQQMAEILQEMSKLQKSIQRFYSSKKSMNLCIVFWS